MPSDLGHVACALCASGPPPVMACFCQCHRPWPWGFPNALQVADPPPQVPGQDQARQVLTWPREVQAKVYVLLQDVAKLDRIEADKVLRKAGWL